MKEQKSGLEHLVIEHNAQARITYQLARQLESHLPIVSYEAIANSPGEVTIDSHRVPLKIFASHVPDGFLPIENVEDLVQKLSIGVRRALELAHSSFPITNPSLRQIFAASFQGEPVRRYGIPVMYCGPVLQKGAK
jgi:hypothetical protein